MQTLELKKIYKPLFSASAKAPQLVDVPHLNFLRIDGAIEPGHAPGNSPIFSENLQALYSASYTLKFHAQTTPRKPGRLPRHAARRPVVGRGRPLRYQHQ